MIPLYKKKSFFGLLMLLVMSVLILSGCGGSSPTTGGGGNPGPTSGNGTISGFIYSLTNPYYNAALSVPLSGATIVVDNASATSAADGSYTITGLGGNATISAAMTGYFAQTLAGVPTTSGQDVHLNPLVVPPSTPASTSVTGTVTFMGAAVPANTLVVCSDVTGNIYGTAFTNAAGAYNITVAFTNGATTGNVTIYSPSYGLISMTAFGYVTANISANTPATVPVIAQNAVTNTTMSVNVTNIPAGANWGGISVSMKLPTGVYVGIGSIVNASGTAVPTGVSGNIPNNIAGVSYAVRVSYDDWYTTNISNTFSANAWRTNLPLANLTINLLTLPILTSPTTVAAANPSTFTWNAVFGAAQYQIALSRAGYGWEGDTSTTSITKPIFVPANGGNLTAGLTYNGRLSVLDIALVGATTNTTTPANPFQIHALSQVGNPGAYVLNPSWSGNYTSSTRNITITAN